ncbi:hypothetical protein [Nostoc commune]|uniref:hypothetical protein n=1 Tax=Nostoc commune TaxID=1178 RepID=UPI0018C661DF|nr:hypothetical protein [Nostoc commune]MBG1258377.1 hypothetical protein [Nostoc commune BAE]
MNEGLKNVLAISLVIPLIPVLIVTLPITIPILIIRDIRDKKEVPIQSGTGIVIGKRFQKGYDDEDYSTPDTYELEIEIEGITGFIEVYRDVYDSTKKGQQIPVEYKIGRNTQTLYVRNSVPVFKTFNPLTD